MRTKYRLRRQKLNDNVVTDFSWITDAEIDTLLQMTTGKPISLLAAAQLYYDAAIREDGTIDRRILKLDIVGYATSLGYRIDIFPEIESSSSAS